MKMNELTAPKVNIGGIGISNILFADVIHTFNTWINTNQKKRVCLTPVNCVVWANKNKNLRDLYNSADLTLCDGVPIIWASRFLGDKIKERVTGLDLLPRYIEECYKNKYSLFFLGAKPGIADNLKEKYETLYPGIKITGTYSPPFAEKFDKEENEKIIRLINFAKPDILWVSLTAPKQDYWIFEHLEKLQVKIAIGVGGAFEVTAGLIQRAPLYMQKNGLEWLYRFYKEPGRLFNRYFMEAPVFIPIVIKQLLKNKIYLKKLKY